MNYLAKQTRSRRINTPVCPSTKLIIHPPLHILPHCLRPEFIHNITKSSASDQVLAALPVPVALTMARYPEIAAKDAHTKNMLIMTVYVRDVHLMVIPLVPVPVVLHR